MIFLISEDILKTEGLLEDNVWAGFIRPAIQLAQEKGLQSLIGTVLYEKILEMVADNTIKDVENRKYKELVDNFIIPYLMWQVMYEISVPITYKTKNQGVITTDVTSNDWNQKLSMSEFQYVVQRYESNATFYGNRMCDYLHAHTSDYPEYLKYECGKMKASNKDFGFGLYLGRTTTCGLRCDLPDTKSNR